jgi:hypothetical protein
MKFCVYNINNDTAVKLEMYLDTTSNGSGGGAWEKVLELVDDGNWSARQTAALFPIPMLLPKVVEWSLSGTQILPKPGTSGLPYGRSLWGIKRSVSIKTCSPHIILLYYLHET